MSSRLDHAAGLCELSTCALLAVDEQQRITFANRAVSGVLGRDRETLPGASLLSLVAEPERERVASRLRVFTEKADLPMTCLDAEVVGEGESSRALSWMVMRLRDESGATVGLLLGLREVSEEEQASARRLRELEDIEHALDRFSIVAATDRRGRITHANDTFCEISGYTRDELLGQDHRLLNSGHHAPPFMKGLWSTISRGQVWHGEIRNRRKDGRHYWVDTTIVPFLDENGRPYQYLSIRTDITARKEAEAKLVEEAALVRLGEMAAVVAHEVKNPLAGMGGALELIRRRLDDESEERKVLGDVLERMGTLTELIDDMLVFARPKGPSFAPVDLRRVLERAVADAEPAEGDVVPVELDGDDLVVRADEAQLHRSLLNLVLNARQASPSGIPVRVGWEVLDDEAIVRITDGGQGMDAETVDRVLEPFFTTRHRGTGLGLPIAMRTAEAHGGRLELASAPGEGTCVTLRLPVSGPRG
ncbi:MAG: PAS domain S-box protein [Acidobacteriota bacterium]